MTPTDLKAMARTRVDVNEEGRTLAYEGVLVGEVLKRAGAPVFSTAELDPAFTSNDIIVADTVDGKPLFDYQGSAAKLFCRRQLRSQTRTRLFDG